MDHLLMDQRVQLFLAVLGLYAAGMALAALVTALSKLLASNGVSRIYERVGHRIDAVDLWLSKVSLALFDSKSLRVRWARLLAINLLICLVGVFAPPYVGLVALGGGLLWSFGVYRAWTSDEHDRAAGLITRRVLVKRDITQEIWFIALNVMCFFVIVYFDIARIDPSSIYIPSSYGSYLGYPAFVAAELQRLTPELRDLELIHGQLAADIHPVPMIGTTVTFAFRVLGDFLIISALLKLWDISTRIRTGRDLRRQEAKLESGRDDLARLAVSELVDFALRWNRANAIEKLLQIADPPEGASLYSPFARFEACRALEVTIAPQRPALGRVIRSTVVETQRQLAGSVDKTSAPDVWAFAQSALAETLARTGEATGGPEGISLLKAAEQASLGAISGSTRDDQRREWANAQNTLGLALLRMGERSPGSDGLVLFRRAEAAFRQALTVRTVERDPNGWARTTENYALTLVRLAEADSRGSAESGVAEAIRLLEEVVQRAEAVAEIDLIAKAHNNIGTTLLRHAERASKNAVVDLRRAESSLLKALALRPPSTHALDWVTTKTNLGYVNTALSERLAGEASIGALRKAEQHLAEAMGVVSEKSQPIAWAAIQNNLGTTRLRLGERMAENREAFDSFKLAISAFESSLKIRNKESMSQDWAATMANLTSARYRAAQLIDVGHRKIQLDLVISECDELLTVVSSDRDAFGWANVMNSKANAQGALAEIDEQLRTDLWEKAITTLKDTRRTLEINGNARYAMILTSINLGVALNGFGTSEPDRVKKNNLLSEAAEIHDGALKLIDRNNEADFWARENNNAGWNLLTLAREKFNEDRSETLKRAEKAFSAALAVWTPEADPKNNLIASNNIAEVRTLLAS
jgi:tetratricopeptide (TPR) repeat protein